MKLKTNTKAYWKRHYNMEYEAHLATKKYKNDVINALENKLKELQTKRYLQLLTPMENILRANAELSHNVARMFAKETF